uniref:Uncharacterized protein n=1 Tax=Anguilla anguilla TaxID=7936 RepID=A0A0E9QSN1_ANGAN
MDAGTKMFSKMFPRLVSARTRSWVFPSATCFRCSVPTPFSLNSFSFL